MPNDFASLGRRSRLNSAPTIISCIVYPKNSKATRSAFAPKKELDPDYTLYVRNKGEINQLLACSIMISRNGPGRERDGYHRAAWVSERVIVDNPAKLQRSRSAPVCGVSFPAGFLPINPCRAGKGSDEVIRPYCLRHTPN